MQALSQSSEYAIRAATYLALQRGDEFRLVRDMSETLGIPAAFLVKLLKPLVARGILESRRGPGGGFRLGKPPSHVTLHDLAEAIEHISGEVPCVLGQAICSDERACPAHEQWKKTYTEFRRFLAHTTLDDVVAFCKDRDGCDYPMPAARRTGG